MPPVRTSHARASKACEACRARKTRCYESGASNSCLRCTTLGIPCSLRDEVSEPILSGGGHSCLLIEQRVLLLERTVQKLNAIVEKEEHSQSQTPTNPDTQRRREFADGKQAPTAPLIVIQDAASSDLGTVGTTEVQTSYHTDIVAKGIVTNTEAQELLNIFHTHYGRWIGLNESKHQQIRVDSVESPLLLSACCLIAIRHSGLEFISATANNLFLETKILLSESNLHTQHSIEFFQATLLLSLWSTTLDQKLLGMDSWLITGIALQQALVTNAFKAMPLTSLEGPHVFFSNYRLAVWNHLCLAHLHACVSMRRRSMITRSDVDNARQMLQSEDATNFEERMVAELNLYFTIYEQCVVADVDLPRAKSALQVWKEEWAFLFNQPRRQFLQTSFLFAGLLVYEQSLNSKSAAVRESLISDMVRLSSDILKLFIETTDDRTKHLTDHVYHIVTFAAVTLCRLLHRYELQLRVRFDLDEMDALVSRIINWLYAIDTSPHISQIMARLISNMQTRLRPGNSHLAETQSELHRIEPDAAAIPDFLGMDDDFDLENFDWDAVVPDWKSIDSGDFLNTVVYT